MKPNSATPNKLRPLMFGLSVSGLVMAIQPASADDQLEAIKGNWSFVTELDNSCTFNGTAFIGEALDGSTTCELTARQACASDGSLSVVRQTCSINTEDGILNIRSQIAEFIGGNVTTGYEPDDFLLWPVGPDEMTGHMDSIGFYVTRWTREAEAIS